jgi:type VI secretion system protein ImpG
MSDGFEALFAREYAALITLAAELPEGVARQLRISRERVSDPHVERLLEGVAYLGARVQARLDDEYPELTDGLLSILYPQMLAPMPSSMLVKITPGKDLRRLLRIEPHTPLRSAKIDGVACRFRTVAPVTVWPIEVESFRLTGRPLPEPAHPLAPNAAGLLRLSLRTLDRGIGFCDLVQGAQTDPGPLRLYFTGGASAMALYRLICNHTIAVTYANLADDGVTDPDRLLMDGAAVVPGGFAPDEALIPWPETGFSGFRLLTEYFTMPEKFLCVDLHGLPRRARTAGNGIDISLYLDQMPEELARSVDARQVALGCVPAVNLFSRRCEPIDLDWTQTEYRLEADRAAPASMEVWSIEEVREGEADGSSRLWRRLFRRDLANGGSDQPGYLPVVRPAPRSIGGTETFLAVDAPGFDPARNRRSRLSVQALCTNRNLPELLPFGREGTPLEAEAGIAGNPAVAAVTPPTPTLRPPERGSRGWQLISQLAMSHLSLVGGQAGAETLREILRVYDLRRSAETAATIAGLLAVRSTEGVARLPGRRPGVFCRGTDIELTFKPEAWRTGGAFLFASVLEQFLRLHATVNSFVRTTVVLPGQKDAVARWPARSGTRELL